MPKVAPALEAARRNGDAHYFTGEPCKHGHIALRSTRWRHCMECARIKAAAIVAANPRRKAEQDKDYAKRNANKLREYKKRHYQINADKIRERTRQWRENNYSRARANERNKLAQRRNAAGKHTARDVDFLFAQQRGKCPVCRGALGNYHVDHVVPLSRGGTNDRLNLQLLCSGCNQSKHAKDPVTFMQQNGFLI